eukprot:XP_020393256.1 uncharacterized protein LOC109939488 [Zea mays]
MAVQISGAAGIVLGAETWRGAKGGRGKIAGRHGRKRWASCCSPWATAARCGCCFMGKRGGEGPGRHGSYCCPWKINRTQEQQGKGGRRPALVLVQGKQGGRREGRAHGGAGRRALAGERLLQGSSAICSSRRGRPWRLAEQRCRPWELLAAMKQKGALGGEAAGGGAMGGASMRWGRRAPCRMGAECHGEKEPSSLR